MGRTRPRRSIPRARRGPTSAPGRCPAPNKGGQWRKFLMDMRDLALALSKVYEHLVRGKIDWASDEVMSLGLGDCAQPGVYLAMAAMRIIRDARAGKLDDTALEAVKAMAATAAWLAEHPL